MTAARRRTAPTLRLHVADLLRRPGQRRDLVVSTPLPGVALSVSRVPDDSSVELELRAESVPDGIVLIGTARAPWSGDCRRCLRPVVGTLTVDLREVFERRPVEGETWPLEGDHIDVEPVVRETVVLELPLAPLCREDCQGLCPECGEVLDEVACGHAPDVRDPRWAELDTVRFDN